MVNALVRKLQAFQQLTADDLQALESLCGDVHEVQPGEDLVREGARPTRVHLLLEGWGYRDKLLPDGGRQILAYRIPGDLCDIHIFVLKTMDHAIGLLNPATVAFIAPDLMLEVMERHPRVERALWWATLVDGAVLREWLVNLGEREAYERIAHLFCEMWLRMRTVGLVEGDAFSLPLTQQELGDTMGLTAVSVNRALQAISGFEPNYLHPGTRTEASAMAAGREPHGAP